MSSYDKAINSLARSKARLSPKKKIQEQTHANKDLRMLNKKNQDTKNFMEYKASQIVRSQDRIR